MVWSIKSFNYPADGQFYDFRQRRTAPGGGVHKSIYFTICVIAHRYIGRSFIHFKFAIIKILMRNIIINQVFILPG